MLGVLLMIAALAGLPATLTQDVMPIDETMPIEDPAGGSPFCSEGCTNACIQEMIGNNEGCPPCVCSDPTFCRPCNCPLTTQRCQCFCINPNEEPPVVEEQDPPPITSAMVSSALVEIAGNMTEISEEIAANRSSLRGCFGVSIHRHINRIDRYTKMAGDSASKALNLLTSNDDVQSRALMIELDNLINGLEKAKTEQEKMTLNVATMMANDIVENGDAAIAVSNLDLEDPTTAGRVYTLYRPRTDVCIQAKSVILWWYPPFWYWYYYFYWSIWHRFYYFWFCIYYIKITIRIKIWWWWIWRPWGWPWYWPWGYCPYWWPWYGYWWRPWNWF